MTIGYNDYTLPYRGWYNDYTYIIEDGTMTTPYLNFWTNHFARSTPICVEVNHYQFSTCIFQGTIKFSLKTINMYSDKFHASCSKKQKRFMISLTITSDIPQV